MKKTVENRSENLETTDKEYALGFHHESIEDAVVSYNPSEIKDIFLYKKLKKKLKLKSNNYEREIDVYIKTSEKDDANSLLHYLKPNDPK